jgi:hypothetical protein
MVSLARAGAGVRADATRSEFERDDATLAQVISEAMSMSRKSGEQVIVPGPADEVGGFVLIGADQIDDTPPEDEDPDLALGSDVHDVEDLERRLGVENLDDMLRAYLDEEPSKK